jgi:hypothetical protein
MKPPAMVASHPKIRLIHVRMNLPVAFPKNLSIYIGVRPV